MINQTYKHIRQDCHMLDYNSFLTCREECGDDIVISAKIHLPVKCQSITIMRKHIVETTIEFV